MSIWTAVQQRRGSPSLDGRRGGVGPVMDFLIEPYLRCFALSGSRSLRSLPPLRAIPPLPRRGIRALLIHSHLHRPRLQQTHALGGSSMELPCSRRGASWNRWSRPLPENATIPWSIRMRPNANLDRFTSSFGRVAIDNRSMSLHNLGQCAWGASCPWQGNVPTHSETSETN